MTSVALCWALEALVIVTIHISDFQVHDDLAISLAESWHVCLAAISALDASSAVLRFTYSSSSGLIFSNFPFWSCTHFLTWKKNRQWFYRKGQCRYQWRTLSSTFKSLKMPGLNMTLTHYEDYECVVFRISEINTLSLHQLQSLQCYCIPLDWPFMTHNYSSLTGKKMWSPLYSGTNMQ